MLYIIAGTSLSGKTTARNQITRSHGINGIDTDTLRTMTNVLRPDMSVGHDKDTMTNYQNMRQTVQAFIYARSFFGEDYILEGDSINLEDIAPAQENGTVRAVITGYPESSVEEVMAILKKSSDSHWSHTFDDEALAAKVQDFIEYSKFLRDESHRLGLTFIDVSHSLELGQSTNAIIEQLLLQ